MSESIKLKQKLQALIDDDASTENEKETARRIIDNMSSAEDSKRTEEELRTAAKRTGWMYRCDRCHAAVPMSSLHISRGRGGGGAIGCKFMRIDGDYKFIGVTGCYYDGKSPDFCYYKVGIKAYLGGPK